MPDLEHLLQNNRTWADTIKHQDPRFFEKLVAQQSPEYMWIGCADSRVPANEIIGLLPGEVFVHRNVGNLVVHTDFNCLSCIQFAVDVLQVKHIIVCGHYGCGGVRAAMKNSHLGLIDNWLRHIRNIYLKYQPTLDAMSDESERLARLCELNVVEQVRNVCQTTIVQSAWERGQKLTVHGWIYHLHDGLLQDLKVRATKPDDIPAFIFS
ncbi:MAG: carbonate dehydratase [Burkholderiales bacterium]|nr:carbonate dehydratase [Anaerolineae bacterium]